MISAEFRECLLMIFHDIKCIINMHFIFACICKELCAKKNVSLLHHIKINAQKRILFIHEVRGIQGAWVIAHYRS